ncbi:MAG: helix-turn-helix domain-containing protein [Candidatus Nanoarchaeia archaeon]
MEMPQELEVWYVIPALRREFAKLMIKKGLKQREVAKKLGVVESAVSHYIKSQRATIVKFDKKIKREIERAVDNLMKNKSSVMQEMQNMIMKIRKSGCLCKLHKQHVKGCEVCMR